MQTESVTILDVKVGDAVKNVADLRENIKILKAVLDDNKASFEDNAKAAELLRDNQQKLRNVMNGVTTTTEDQLKNVDRLIDENGNLNGSYNDLVKTLGELKRSWRATTDETERANLGKEIAKVDSKLKELDYGVGSFKRNVGNYPGLMAQIANGFQGVGGSAMAVINPVKNLTMGFKTLSATPVVAILGVLINLFQSVRNHIKASEETMNSMTAAMAPFKAGGDMIARVLDTLSGALAKAATWMTNLLDKLHLLSAEAKARQQETKDAIALEQRRRDIMVQNAESEQRISDLRAKMAEKDKYSASERMKYAEQWRAELLAIAQRNREVAAEELRLAEADAAHSANSKEANDAIAQAKVNLINATTTYNQQLKTANATIAEIFNTMKKTTSSSSVGEVTSGLKAIDSAWLEHEGTLVAALRAEKEEREALQALTDAGTQEASILAEEALAEAYRETEAAAEAARIAEENRFEALRAGANVAASVLESLADVVESTSADDEDAAAKTKGLRIASATIDTIQGALTAYTSAQRLGPPLGPIVGAANAAAVTATGVAQIAKIKSTKVGRSGSPGGGSLSGAMVSAPRVVTQIPSTTIARTASDTESLNRLKDQRVYILSSDLETNSRKVAIRNSETTF